MFTKSAAFYDAIYHWKDYESEAAQIHQIIQARKRSAGNRLLDVACGTGSHAVYLQAHYAITGVDLDGKLLGIARQRLPDSAFHEMPMQALDLDEQFDAVICLFSSIAYVREVNALKETLRRFHAHTVPGGVVIVEPWLTPEVIRPQHIRTQLVEGKDLDIVRMARTEVIGRVSVLHFEYLVGTPNAIEHFSERHEMALFTHEEYLHAFADAGLEVEHIPEGITGRGLYIGVRPVT